MSPLEQIEKIKQSISNLPHNVRTIYTNGMALRNIWLDKKAELLSELSRHPAPNPLDVPNGTSHPYGFVRSPVFTEVAVLRLVLDLAEESAEFKDAEAVISPKLEEIARLKAVHQAAVQVRSDKARALAEAEESALAKAQAAALESPEVVKARAALEALDAPAPSKPKRQPADPIGEVS